MTTLWALAALLFVAIGSAGMAAAQVCQPNCNNPGPPGGIIHGVGLVGTLASLLLWTALTSIRARS